MAVQPTIELQWLARDCYGRPLRIGRQSTDSGRPSGETGTIAVSGCVQPRSDVLEPTSILVERCARMRRRPPRAGRGLRGRCPRRARHHSSSDRIHARLPTRALAPWRLHPRSPRCFRGIGLPMPRSSLHCPCGKCDKWRRETRAPVQLPPVVQRSPVLHRIPLDTQPDAESYGSGDRGSTTPERASRTPPRNQRLLLRRTLAASERRK